MMVKISILALAACILLLMISPVDTQGDSTAPKKAIQEFLKKGKELGRAIEDQNADHYCVGCSKFKSLTSELNRIIGKMSADPLTMLEPIESMEEIHYITKTSTDLSDPGKSCFLFLNSSPELDLIGDPGGSLQWVFTNDLDLSKVESFHYKNGEKDVRFFRGKGSQRHVIVRLDIMPDGSSKVSYYKLPTQKTKRSTESKVTHLKTEAPPADLPHFNLEYGTVIRDKHGLPKQIIFIDMEHLTEHIASSTVVSTRGLETNVKLRSSQKEVVALGLKSTGANAKYTITVPTTIHIYATDVTANGNIQFTQDELYALVSLDGQERNFGVIEAKSKIDGKSREIRYSKTLDPKSSITVRYSRDKFTEGMPNPRDHHDDKTIFAIYRRVWE